MKILLLALVSSLLLQGEVSAQLTAEQESRIFLWGTGSTVSFGANLDLEGATAVVSDTGDSFGRGAAYVLQQNGLLWLENQKLQPVDTLADHSFGADIELQGSRLVISATSGNGAATDSGAAYVYGHDGSSWIEEAKLFAADGEDGDSFGVLALDGDTLAIGAPLHPDSTNGGGAVYIFVWDGLTWTQQAKIVSADIASQDRFGTSVDLQGDLLVVGASQDDDLGDRSGSAYIFERSGTTWGQVTKLLAPDGSELDRFGSRVVLDGDTIAVSAPNDGTPVFEPGAVHIFRYDGSTWTHEQKVTAFNQDSFSFYGATLALSGDILAVGAPFDGIGKTFVYQRGSSVWIERASIEDWNADDGGGNLAISGTTILSGAPGGSAFNDDRGIVLVIRIGATPLTSPSRLYVDADAAGPGDGASWSTAYNDLYLAAMHAEAIFNSTTPVADLWIAEGIYKATTHPADPFTTFELRDMSIHGGFSGNETAVSQQDPVAHPTILDGDILGDDLPQHVNFSDNTEVLINHQSSLAGLEISGLIFHSANEAGLDLHDGAVVRDCVFAKNTLGLRALVGSAPSPTIRNCTFKNNYSFASTPGLRTSGSGQPIAVSDCVFEGNVTRNNGSSGAASGGNTHYIRCTFLNNESTVSSGALSFGHNSRVIDSTFIGNTAFASGGAIFWDSGGAPGPGGFIINCLFSGNTTTLQDGGAIYVRNANGPGFTLIGCTLANNSSGRNGGALFASGNVNPTNPVLRNCIVWGNEDQNGAGEASQVATSGMATPMIDNCCIQGWTGSMGGIGNIGDDPMFFDVPGADTIPGTVDDDYRLMTGSPSIDAGNANFLPADVTDQDQDGDTDEPISRDLDGQSRVISLAPDMGPYEYACLPAPSFCDASDGSLSGCPCGNVGNPDTGCDIQQGTGGVGLCVWGQETSPQNALTLRGSGFSTTGSPAVIVIRSSGLEASPFPFGDGLRCLSTPLVRLGATIATNGVSSHELGHGAMAGTGDFYYQLWFRNTPSAFCTPDAFNLSNGRVVTW